jgi:hypothetical protein
VTDRAVERIEIRKGDRLPGFQAIIEDEVGVALSLTDASVFLCLRHHDTTGGYLEAPCLIVSAAAGQVYYDWQSTSEADVGVYDLSVRAELSDGSTVVAGGVELVILPSITIPDETLLIDSDGNLLIDSDGNLLRIIQ